MDSDISQAFDLIFDHTTVPDEDSLDPLAGSAIKSAIEEVFFALSKKIAHLKTISFKDVKGGATYSDVVKKIHSYNKEISAKIDGVQLSSPQQQDVDTKSTADTRAKQTQMPKNFMELESNFTSLQRDDESLGLPDDMKKHDLYPKKDKFTKEIDFTGSDFSLDYHLEEPDQAKLGHPQASNLNFASMAPTDNISQSVIGQPTFEVGGYNPLLMGSIYCASKGEKYSEHLFFGKHYIARLDVATRKVEMLKHNIAAIINVRKWASYSVFFCLTGTVLVTKQETVVYRYPGSCRSLYSPKGQKDNSYIYSSKGTAVQKNKVLFINENQKVVCIDFESLEVAVGNGLQYSPDIICDVISEDIHVSSSGELFVLHSNNYFSSSTNKTCRLDSLVTQILDSSPGNTAIFSSICTHGALLVVAGFNPPIKSNEAVFYQILPNSSGFSPIESMRFSQEGRSL